MVAEAITAYVPFIPDLLMEESHGLANAFKMISAQVGALFASGMLGLSSTKILSDKALLFIVFGINTFAAFVILFAMKDVINSKDFLQRR